MKTGNCIDCGVMISYEPLELFGQEVFRRRVCGPCAVDRERKAAEEQARTARALLVTEWQAICSGTYRNTDPSDCRLNQAVLSSVLKWRPGERGLGLIGGVGAGKTRMMFLLLRDLHFGGTRVRYVRATELARLASAMFDDHEGAEAKARLRQFERTAVLFIDDLRKERFSERVTERLYDLIEARGSERPTLWTSNHNSAKLTLMMGERGSAIVRRLKDFSRVIEVRRPIQAKSSKGTEETTAHADPGAGAASRVEAKPHLAA